MIRIENLQKSYGKTRAVDGIDLSVAPDWLGFGDDLRLEASAS